MKKQTARKANVRVELTKSVTKALEAVNGGGTVEQIVPVLALVQIIPEL
jgi:hypothetical protein